MQIPAIEVKFSGPDKVSSSHLLYITEKIHWVFGDTNSISKKKWPVKKFGYVKIDHPGGPAIPILSV